MKARKEFLLLMPSWKEFLKEQKTLPYFQKLIKFLENEFKVGKIIYPDHNVWLRALDLCPLEHVQVVFLGQDPYHTPNVADGLAFSTQQKQLPPSLKNIFLEVQNAYPNFKYQSGDLTHWAKQGVLLINRVLTVEEGLPTSHYQRGWEEFTTRLLNYLVVHKQQLVFVLLGQKAQSLKNEINLVNQHLIELPHPSPFSAHRGFLGSNLFWKINTLVKHKIEF